VKSLHELVTDAILVTDEWDNFDFNIDLQIKELEIIDFDSKPETWKENTLGRGYLAYCEKLLKKSGADSSILTVIEELKSNISKYENMRLFLQTLRLAIMVSRMGAVPGLAQLGEKRSQTQRENRNRRQTWKGLTKIQRKQRNEKIIEHFETSKAKNPQISVNGFAAKYASQYGLQKTQFIKILTSQ